MGIGTSAGSGVGFAVVADMYFMHERGRYEIILDDTRRLLMFARTDTRDITFSCECYRPALKNSSRS